MKLIDKYTKEELQEQVYTVNSMSELLLALGYSSTNTSSRNAVKQRLIEDNIDISSWNYNTNKKTIIHFSPYNIK